MPPGWPPGVPSRALALAALLVAAALLLPARSGRSGVRARSRGPGTIVPLVGCLLCGAALGARTAERIDGACTARLPRDAPVAAVGLLRQVERRAETFGEGWSSRAELSPVEIRAGGSRCVLPSLAAWTDGLDVPRPGSVVEVRGRWRPYSFDAGLRPPDQRGSVQADRIRRRPRPTAAGPAGGLLRATGASGIPGLAVRAAAARWRGRAAGRLQERLPPDAAALARALTLADRGGLPAALTERFARAGLAHVLAISGLHVGVLAAAATWLFGLGLPTGSRHVAAATVTALYVAWIGAPASAVRASILFGGWALSRLRGSPVRTSDLLGAAAAAALLADPATLVDPGFQLSFAGFGGVVLGTAAGSRCTEGRELGRRARGLILAAAAGAGACALTAPLTALHFHRAAPVAVLSGLFGTPLVGLVLLSSLAVLVLPGWTAGPAAGAATGLLRVLTEGVETFASVPWGHVAAAPPGAGYWLTALLLLGALIRYARTGDPVRTLTPLAGAALAVLSWPAVASTWTDVRARGGTLVCSLDVGQGDASALRTRDGHWILVDAGPGPPPGRPGRDEGLSTVVPFLRDRGARAVDLLVLSHPDLDHLGGAGAIFDRFGVRRVVSSGAPVPGGPHLRFLSDAGREGARWLSLRTGDRIVLDEVEILVLDAGAAPRGAGGRPAPSNDSGLSLRVRVDGGFTWITTGDASMEREVAMMRRWPTDSLRAHLLSVGHHGSLTSTLPSWLDVVSPEAAVISAGDGNRFGHPHPVTLLTLDEADVRVLRTDRHGTVCVHAHRDGSWRVEGPRGL